MDLLLFYILASVQGKAMNCDHLLRLGMTAKKILENGRGILAADESPETLGQRLERVGMENTRENRRRFRELLFTTRSIEDHVGGVILNPETFEQTDSSGTLLTEILRRKDIEVGVKLDKGLIDYKEQEKVSVGLEDLDLRCKCSSFRDASFAKWRSLFHILGKSPSEDCISENCSVLAKYAIICQRNGLVPIVEPEILLEGSYSMEDAEKVFRRVLSTLMRCLNYEQVYMPGILIKPSFITSGSRGARNEVRSVALSTFRSLLSTVPCGVPGIVFLSGGHSSEDSLQFLNAINLEKGCRTWTLSFSFARALTDGVLEAWRGKDTNALEAQKILLEATFRASRAVEGLLEGCRDAE